MGKEEIAYNEQFLLFPQCFRLNQVIVSPFVHIYDVKSLFATELEEPKIGISGILPFINANSIMRVIFNLFYARSENGSL